MGDDLLSVREAARAIGMSHSTLLRQIKAGKIRAHDGKVRLSEVLEDRANNIDASIWEARRQLSGQAVHAPDDDEREDDDCVVLVDDVALPIAKAKALKETYLARLRRLEFDEKSGRLVDAETVQKAVFELSRQDRDAWSNWPAQVSPLMAAELGIDQVALSVVLERYVREHLAERSRSAPLRLAKG
jgi:hypothetical protein